MPNIFDRYPSLKAFLRDAPPDEKKLYVEQMRLTRLVAIPPHTKHKKFEND